MKSLDPVLEDGDALIIVPPLALIERPSLGPHILQSCAKEIGYEVKILYTNQILASEIGIEEYNLISRAPLLLMGERLFARAAFSSPPLGRDIGDLHKRNITDLSKLELIEGKIFRWLDAICEEIKKYNFKVVGCTSSFDQTAASVAFLNRIKQARPNVITIIGGSNCEGEMAEGIISLGASIDYVFSGECEESFPNFLKGIDANIYPSQHIISGAPCLNLDNIPSPDFSDFFEQIKYWFSDHPHLITEPRFSIHYESSRGCWWGEKRPCTFCGLNGKRAIFRQKSPGRIFSEMKEVFMKNYPIDLIQMTDNVMPRDYFQTVIPRISELQKKFVSIKIFYEQRANLSLEQIVLLKKANISIQAGIESLSTNCLKLMNKGVSARQNIALLRYARSANLDVFWNILYGIPGDKIKYYRSILDIIPFLHHLQPPISIGFLVIDRFSAYFKYPERYNIDNIRPLKVYSAIFPSNTDIGKIAYHFVADYESESRSDMDLIKDLNKAIVHWRDIWYLRELPPLLMIIDIGDDRYMLMDTRQLPGTQMISFLNKDQAALALIGLSQENEKELDWAIENKLIINMDSKYIPLATTIPETLHKFEEMSRSL